MLVQAAAILHWAATISEIIVAVRLSFLPSRRRMRFFIALLLFDGITSIPLAAISARSPAYLDFWSLKQPPLILLTSLAAYECCRSLAESYKGYRRTGALMAAGCCVLGIISAVATMTPQLMGFRSLVGWQVFAVARGAEGIAIATTMLAAAVLFAVIPAPARPNSVTHSQIFAAYVAADAIGYQTSRGIAGMWSSLGTLMAYMICLFCWAFLIRKPGESLAQTPYVSPEDAKVAAREADHAIKQLWEDL